MEDARDIINTAVNLNNNNSTLRTITKITLLVISSQTLQAAKNLTFSLKSSKKTCENIYSNYIDMIISLFDEEKLISYESEDYENRFLNQVKIILDMLIYYEFTDNLNKEIKDVDMQIKTADVLLKNCVKI